MWVGVRVPRGELDRARRVPSLLPRQRGLPLLRSRCGPVAVDHGMRRPPPRELRSFQVLRGRSAGRLLPARRERELRGSLRRRSLRPRRHELRNLSRSGGTGLRKPPAGGNGGVRWRAAPRCELRVPGPRRRDAPLRSAVHSRHRRLHRPDLHAGPDRHAAHAHADPDAGTEHLGGTEPSPPAPSGPAQITPTPNCALTAAGCSKPEIVRIDGCPPLYWNQDNSGRPSNLLVRDVDRDIVSVQIVKRGGPPGNENLQTTRSPYNAANEQTVFWITNCACPGLNCPSTQFFDFTAVVTDAQGLTASQDFQCGCYVPPGKAPKVLGGECPPLFWNQNNAGRPSYVEIEDEDRDVQAVTIVKKSGPPGNESLSGTLGSYDSSNRARALFTADCPCPGLNCPDTQFYEFTATAIDSGGRTSNAKDFQCGCYAP